MNKETTGTVVSVSRQWWLKVNTKAVRAHALDGAIFPYVIKVNYTVDSKEYMKRKGELPKILTFSMAAFIAFYCGAKKEDGSFAGVRAAGNEYPIVDDQFVLDFFAGMQGKTSAEIAHAVLTNEAFWGSDLTAELPGFEASVAASLEEIRTDAKAAIAKVVG